MSRRARPVVLVCGPTRPETGGVQTVIRDQLASSVTDRFQLLLFDNSKRTRADRTFLEGALSQLRLMLELLMTLLRVRPDVVHIHAGGGTDIFRKGIDVMLAALCRRAIVLHIHGGDFDRYFTTGARAGELDRIRLIFNRCRAVIALAPCWRDMFARVVAPERVHVVPNCVDVGRYEGLDKAGCRARLGIEPGARVVLMLGSQGERKGTFDIVEAAARVLRELPPALFLLVGPDEDVCPGAIDRAGRMAVEAGIAGRVRLLGPRTGDAQRDCYGAADLFILPSRAENMPVSILEAMAAGLPVIATPVGGVPDILPSADHGILIEPGDAHALAEAILFLLRDPARRDAMGRRNAQRAGALYSRARYGERLAAVYDAMLGRGASGVDPRSA